MQGIVKVEVYGPGSPPDHYASQRDNCSKSEVFLRRGTNKEIRGTRVCFQGPDEAQVYIARELFTDKQVLSRCGPACHRPITD